MPYSIELSAPGFQKLRKREVEFSPDDETVIVMRRSRPATGVVRNADDRPAAGAQLLLQADLMQEGSLAAGSLHGDVRAVADDEGQFSIGELSSDSRYFFVVKSTDGARAIVRDIVEGATDLQIHVPPRRDLKVRIVGDLDELPQRKGQPFVSVRQRIEMLPDGRPGFSGLIGDDMTVSPTPDGGEFIYSGLVEGDVELIAGDRSFPITPSENQLTEITIEIPDNPRAGDDRKNSKVDEPNSENGGRRGRVESSPPR